jgi:diguanylate cyclase (GGDEF)-like protein
MPKILIVDDNFDMLETLEHLFSFYQFDVVKAENGKRGVEEAEKHLPDIILLDAYMPVMDGFEACKILKKKRKTRQIPIVFLTAKYLDPADRASGMQLGADDYMVKPFNSKELVNRIKTILKKKQMISTLKEKNKDLARQQAHMLHPAGGRSAAIPGSEENTAIDPLTGLYSKRYIMGRLKEEFHRALRYELPLSFLMIDVDGFTRVNDNFGFQAGDYVLLKMANIILTHTRLSDIVARFEGANFLVILPQTDAQGGYFEAERLRIALGQADYIDNFLIDLENRKQRKRSEIDNLTVSIGIATYPAESEIGTEKDLLKVARQALDKAKLAGRNKTKTLGKIE